MSGQDRQQPQLRMRRSLRALPELELPDQYALRSFRPDYIDNWISLLNDNGELGTWTEERARPYFEPGSAMPLAGSFFITEGEYPVATAQLHLHRDDKFAPVPELGWVAVRPESRGHGLGYLCCLAVLHHAAATGHDTIFLQTDDERLPAIATYLKLGFEPWMDDASSPGRWQTVVDNLKRP